MKKIKLKNIALGALLVLGSGIGTLAASAATHQQSMHVSPPNQRMILIPGETYTDSLVISNANDSTRALKYELAIGSFSEGSDGEGDDDYGTVDHISVSNYNQIMDWITLDREGGTIEPNQKEVVNYTINVPENAPAGGQYATILVRDVTDQGATPEGNVSIQNTMQFGSIIYAEVAGETKEDGMILANNVPTFLFSTPLTVSSMVENGGNVHADAEYTLEVWPLFSDEEVYTNAEEPKTSLILPETKRYNTQTWDEAPMLGIFKVKQTVKLFGDVSTVEKIVIICPLWLLLVIILVIIAIIVWLITRSKSRKKSHD